MSFSSALLQDILMEMGIFHIPALLQRVAIMRLETFNVVEFSNIQLNANI